MSVPYTQSCCPKDCPRRSPYCHNAQTCEDWARHEVEVKQQRQEKKKRYAHPADVVRGKNLSRLKAAKHAKDRKCK